MSPTEEAIEAVKDRLFRMAFAVAGTHGGVTCRIQKLVRRLERREKEQMEEAARSVH